MSSLLEIDARTKKMTQHILIGLLLAATACAPTQAPKAERMTSRSRPLASLPPALENPKPTHLATAMTVLRSAPHPQAAIVHQCRQGTKLTVRGEYDEWVAVQVGQLVAWTEKDGLIPVRRGSWKAPRGVIIHGQLYTWDSPQDTVVTHLRRNEQLDVACEENGDTVRCAVQNAIDFGGEFEYQTFLTFKDGVLVAAFISFPTQAFPHVLLAAQKRLGNATHQEEVQVRDFMNTRFPKKELIWEFSTTVVALTNHRSDNIFEGGLWLRGVTSSPTLAEQSDAF